MSTLARIMWDHCDQFPIDELAAALAPYGLTVQEFVTGADRYEIEISGPDLPEDLAAIEARARNATPGPWLHYGDGEKEVYVDPDVWDDAPMIACDLGRLADAEFIAAARTDIPALLAKVRRLETERDEARAEAEQLRGDIGAAIQALPDGSVARTLAEQISNALADARADGIRRMEAGRAVALALDTARRRGACVGAIAALTWAHQFLGHSGLAALADDLKAGNPRASDLTRYVQNAVMEVAGDE